MKPWRKQEGGGKLDEILGVERRCRWVKPLLDGIACYNPAYFGGHFSESQDEDGKTFVGFSDCEGCEDFDAKKGR